MKNGYLKEKLSLNHFWLILTFLLSFHNISYAAAQIGVVVSVDGKATANSRSLARRSPIYNGDTILTASASKVSFKFTDGSVVSLSENSNYKINNYAYKKQGGPDVFDANLNKGGLKTTTGVIGKEALHTTDAIDAGIPVNKQVKVAYYKQKASVATIGVRGTEYKCLIDESDNKVKVSALDGTLGVDFFNEYVELGDGADASYLEIALDGNYIIDTQDPIDDDEFDDGDDDDGDDDDGDDGDQDSSSDDESSDSGE